MKTPFKKVGKSTSMPKMHKQMHGGGGSQMTGPSDLGMALSSARPAKGSRVGNLKSKLIGRR